MWSLLVALAVSAGGQVQPLTGGEINWVPGELIVSFEREDITVMFFSDGAFASAYPALNDIFDDWQLAEVRYLFSSRSLMKNIFTLVFPPETDLDELGELISRLPFVKNVGKNWVGGQVDYVPRN